jgi:hypothetical protein
MIPAPAPRHTSAWQRVLRATVGWALAKRRYPSICAREYGCLARSLGSGVGLGSG